jgi:hypothetical protein
MSERKQLELSQHELEAIGFMGHYAPADTIYDIAGKVNNPARVWYSIPVTNGEFIYNVDNDPYKWYLKTKIGDACNYNLLNIERVEELYMVLSCFRAMYNLVIF